MSTPAPIESVHQALSDRAALVLAQPPALAVPSPCVAVCQMQADTGWCPVVQPGQPRAASDLAGHCSSA